MRFFFLFTFAVSILLLSSCNASKQTASLHKWKDVAVIEELEVYVDTATLKYADGLCYAWIKTAYMTDKAREQYTGRIRESFVRQNADVDKKMGKWDGFQYNISYRVYDCVNRRYKTLEVTDYTFSDEKIITTKPSKNNEVWVDVSADTMGDYTLYYICDYDTE